MKKIKKPLPLKARGVRLDEETKVWERLEKIAARDKTKRTKASDLVRVAVDEFLERNE